MAMALEHNVLTPLGPVVFTAHERGFGDILTQIEFSLRVDARAQEDCQTWLAEIQVELRQLSKDIVVMVEAPTASGDISGGERLCAAVFTDSLGWLAIGFRDHEWCNERLGNSRVDQRFDFVTAEGLQDGIKINIPIPNRTLSLRTSVSMAFAPRDRPEGELEVWRGVDRLLEWDAPSVAFEQTASNFQFLPFNYSPSKGTPL
jgi:hypothetical protein